MNKFMSICWYGISIILIGLISIILTGKTNQNMVLPIITIILVLIGTILCIINKYILVYILILLSVFYIVILSIFKIDIMRYLLDYFIIIAIFKIIISRTNKFGLSKKCLLFLNVLLLLLTIIGLIINHADLYPAINGIWKYFKFFIVFWYIINLKLNKRIIFNINKLIIIISLLQLPVTLIQYIIGLDRDFIGGIFRAGGTGILMMFNFWAICYYTSEIKNYRISIKKYIMVMIVLLIPSILGEIKATFLFLPLVFIYLFFEFKISLRNIILIIMGFLASIVLMRLLIIVYPAFSTLFTDKDYFMEYTFLGKYGDYGLNRFSAIYYVVNNVLIGIIPMMFGIGIGQATPSRSILFTGKFYIENSGLRYEWFQAPYMLLESGILGLAVYIGILLFIACICKKSKKKEKDEIESIILSGGAFAFIHIINIFYNQIMLEYYGVFFWSMLAISLNALFNIGGKYEEKNKNVFKKN